MYEKVYTKNLNKIVDKVYIMVYITNIGEIYANRTIIFKWQESSCKTS